MAPGQSWKCKKKTLYEVKSRLSLDFQLWPGANSKPVMLRKSNIAPNSAKWKQK